MQKQPALVGIVPRKSLWPIIQKEKWYHIPVKSAPKNTPATEYIAFYFPKAFGEEYQYKVIYYAKVSNIDMVKRIQLFPKEPKHERAQEKYYQFHLGQIRKLPQAIPSKRWRMIVHVPTSRQKLFTAKEINDLYDTSPLEDKMYQIMKKEKINAERQVYVKVNNQFYCLDFGIFCKKGNIDVECDGEKYHILPEALARDRQRNNQLTSYGWRVLRFSGKEIYHSIQRCLGLIKKTIYSLNGLVQSK